MSMQKVTIALAIISLSAGLSATRAEAQAKPKLNSHIKYSTASFSADGEMDTDDDLSNVYLTNIRVKTANRDVPVVSNIESPSNLANSLYVGTGICVRAGINSIGWVTDYSQPKAATDSSYSDRAKKAYSSIANSSQQSDPVILAVQLTSSGQIAKRFFSNVTQSQVIGVYCQRSMDAKLYYTCQYGAAKNATPNANQADADALFAADANACMAKQVAASAPAPVQTVVAPAPATPVAPAAPAADATIPVDTDESGN